MIATRFIQFLFCLLLCVSIISLRWAHQPFVDKSVRSSHTLWTEVVQKLSVKKNTFSLHAFLSLFPKAQAAEGFDNASSYIVVNQDTGEIVKEKNGDSPFFIASLTKIMSAVVTLDLLSPTTSITISPRAANVIPTKIGVVPGQKMTVEELLQAMLMTSANDAAQALADGIDEKYGVGTFVKAMNEKAFLLNLKDTHFANPQGFDNLHNKSSASDMAILSSYALTRYSLIATIVKEPYVFLPANIYHKQFDLYNWNGLLGVYPGISGIKIGNTDKAGFTMIVSDTRNNHRLLVVLFGAPSLLQRDMWVSELLDTVFAEQYGLSPIHVTSLALQKKYATWQEW